MKNDKIHITIIQKNHNTDNNIKSVHKQIVNTYVYMNMYTHK